MGGVDRQANHLSREEVFDGSHVDDFVLERNSGEIRYPDVVFVGRIRGEQEIGVHHLDIAGLFPLPTTTPICLDAENIHHSFYLLPVHVEVESETP